jgi:hypothetical protein
VTLSGRRLVGGLCPGVAADESDDDCHGDPDHDDRDPDG